MTKDASHVNVSEILASHARQILHDFHEDEKTSPLAVDRGAPREDAVRKFLGDRLPGRYGIASGIVIDAQGGQSKQCDVVIYDRERTPRLSTERAMSIWPFEFVYAVAEVKSKLTKAKFREAVENIAAFKRLKRARNNFAGGAGVYYAAGFQNPACGLLIAHDWGDDLQPETPEFDEILKSVPEPEQLDLYCVISGHAGCRATEDGERTLIGLMQQTPSPMQHLKAGEGALAWFLLITIGLLNGVNLGTGLWGYLKFLPEGANAE